MKLHLQVAAERYFRIVHPFLYERWAKRLMVYVILCFWVLPTPSTFLAILLDWHQAGAFTRIVGNDTIPLHNDCGKAKVRPCRCSFWGSGRFTTITTVFQYGLPFVCMIYFYTSIFIVALRQARKIEKLKESVAANSINSAPNGTQGGGLQIHHGFARRTSHTLFFSKDIRVVRLCALVLVTFVVCQIPFSTMMWLESFCIGVFYLSDDQILWPDPESRRTDQKVTAAFFAALWIGLSNSLINPLLLFFLEKSYRQGLSLLLFRHLPKFAKIIRLQNPILKTYVRNRSNVSESVTEDSVDSRHRKKLSFQMSQITTISSVSL